MDFRCQEWLNLNSTRYYPFIECSDDIVPYGLILDIIISAPKTITMPISIKQINISISLVSLIIIDNNNEFIGFASGECKDKYNKLTISNFSRNVSGTIIIGDIGSVTNKHIILNSSGTLNNSCVILTENSGVDSISNKISTEILTKDIVFAAGDGIKIESVNNTITFSLVDPISFLPELYRTSTPGQCSPKAIYQINSVLPNTNGNIGILGDNVFVEVSENENTIHLNTPKLGNNDICDNGKDNQEGSIGAIGAIGGVGGSGGNGIVICSTEDCCCELCDAENLEQCEE